MLEARDFDMELDIAGLQSRNEFALQSVDLNQVMQGVNLEELREVVNSNQNVNDTIKNLMANMDKMKEL